MESQSIKKKNSLLISGLNPYEAYPVRRTLTDYASSDSSLVIVVTEDSKLEQLTLKDMDIVGKNYFGTVTVRDNKRGMELIYDNITYQGPQITFHRRGTSVYRDCDITIGKYEETSEANEVGEVADVIFEGQVTITQSTSQVNEIFYFPLQGGNIILKEGAQVYVETYDHSGFIYIEDSSYIVDMKLEENASFTYKGRERFWEKYAIHDLTIASGASMRLTTDGNQVTDTLRMRGDLYVGSDAVLHLSNLQTGSYPVLQINSGSITLDNPSSVVLYHTSRRPLEFMVQGRVNIVAGQINTWTAAGDGGLEDEPLYHWKKSDNSRMTLNAAVNIGSGGQLTDIQTNYDPGVDVSANVEPNVISLDLVSQRVFSVGDLDITAYLEINSENIKLFGFTKSAALLAAHDHEGNPLQDAPVFAGGNGYFEIVTDQQIQDNSVIQVEAVWNYLRTTVGISYFSGRLSMEMDPENIDFGSIQISRTNMIVERVPQSFSIVVTDSRGTDGNWTLWLEQMIPLTPTDADLEGISMPADTLVYIDEVGETYYLGDGPIEIASHKTTDYPDVTEIQCAAGEGILAKIYSGSAYTGTYEGKLLWTLVDAP